MRRRHGLQVEGRRAEGRRQERDLHVHAEEHAEPDREVFRVELAEEAERKLDKHKTAKTKQIKTSKTFIRKHSSEKFRFTAKPI